MRDIIKLALRLFIFSLVAAVALAVTNEVTKGPIAEQKIAAQKEALNKVLPGYEYAEVENIEGLPEDSLVDQLFTATDPATGEIKGYALVANPQGYGGPIPITVGVSTEGYVTQTYVGALSETAGLGTRVGEPEFMDQFIAIPADPDTLSDHVDTIGGATVSSSAFIGGVSDMLSYTKETLAIAPNAGDKDAILAAASAASGETAEPVVTANTYDVTGFSPMKVEVAVDETGKIVSVTVLEHNETPGFGADLIADTTVFDALVGQDIATAQIDVKSGVTMTSGAINDALKLAGSPAESSAVVYDVQGFQPMKVAIEVDADGKIVSVSVPEHGETPGFGADLIADTAVFDALVGQDIASAQIDVKSGVTMTSNGINDALKQAAASAAGETGPSGDPFTVKGFSKLTLYIEAADGKIVSVSAPDHGETPGFGADLLTEEALAALIGQDLSTAQVDVKSGVTMTSSAINNALKQAAAANGIAVETASEETASAAPSEVPVYDAQGFQPMKVAIEVDEAGKIVSVEVVEHNETPGFGADLIADTAVFGALVGQDIATAQIDVKSAVTMTSNGINDALKQAAAAAPASEEAAESAAVVYDAQGFQPMKVAIEVDEAGKIVSVEVVEHNETPGFGADLIADTAVFDALVGQDIATAQIDVKSAVTMTSNGINDALKQAAAAAPASDEADASSAATTDASSGATVSEEAAETEQAVIEGTTYSINLKGFSKHPFVLDITVDAEGKIAAATCPENSETEGYGADLLADEALSVLIGQNIAQAQIDIKTGATVTSNAINNALSIIGKHAAPNSEETDADATADETAETEQVSIEGMTYSINLKGFSKHPFVLDITVDAEGKIAAATCPENSETEGYGADLLTDEALSVLIGQNIAQAQIDIKTGATVTSNAINNALSIIAKEVQ